MLEVGEENLRLAGKDRQSGIVPHRVDSLHPGLRHWGEDHIEFLLVQPVGNLELGPCQRIVRGIFRHDRFGRDNLPELGLMLTQPFTVGLLRSEALLDLFVENDFAFFGIDHNHFSGSQPPLLLDHVIGEVAGADLGSERENPIGRDLVSGRTQSVSIEGRSDRASIGESQCRWTVPGLGKTAVIAIEILDLLGRERVDLPRWRHEHGHCVRNGASRKHEQFEGRIETRRVGPVGIDDVMEMLEFIPPDLALELTDPGVQPVSVSAHRVDLSVVTEHPERLGECPCWEGVR